MVKRAHVMQAIGELYEEYADVIRQRQQEFSQVLSGTFVFRLGLDLAELGDAVDKPRDVLSKQLLDLVGGCKSILDRVVEDRGGDRLVVELEVGQDSGDLDRVAELGIARGALLIPMRLHREDIGAVDQPLVRIRIIGADLLDQLILSQHRPKMGDPSAIVQARKREAGTRSAHEVHALGLRGSSPPAPKPCLLGGDHLA